MQWSKLPLDTPIGPHLSGTGAVAKHLQGACQWRKFLWFSPPKTENQCCSYSELVQKGCHPLRLKRQVENVLGKKIFKRGPWLQNPPVLSLPLDFLNSSLSDLQKELVQKMRDQAGMNKTGVIFFFFFNIFGLTPRHVGASLVAQLVKNPPAMQETQVWSLGGEDPLEKEMATHPSILAWKIPGTEEPDKPQFIGLQRVRYDLVTKPPSWPQHVPQPQFELTLPAMEAVLTTGPPGKSRVHNYWSWVMGIWPSQVALVVKNPPFNEGDRFDLWVRKIPWRRSNPLQSSCLEESHGQRSLAGYSP